MESKLQAAVESAFGPEDGFAIDIIAILAIIEAVMTMIQNCQNQNAAVDRMRSPSVLDEVRLRIAVRRQVSNDDRLLGLRKQVNGIVSKLKAKASSMDAEELRACVAEAIA